MQKKERKKKETKKRKVIIFWFSVLVCFLPFSFVISRSEKKRKRKTEKRRENKKRKVKGECLSLVSVMFYFNIFVVGVVLVESKEKITFC